MWICKPGMNRDGPYEKGPMTSQESPNFSYKVRGFVPWQQMQEEMQAVGAAHVHGGQ